jgi:hypothetical protein
MRERLNLGELLILESWMKLADVIQKTEDIEVLLSALRDKGIAGRTIRPSPQTNILVARLSTFSRSTLRVLG